MHQLVLSAALATGLSVGGLVGDVERVRTTCVVVSGTGSDTTVIFVNPGQIDGCSDGVAPGPETMIPIDLRGKDEIIVHPTVGHPIWDASVRAHLQFRARHALAVEFALSGIAATNAATSINGRPFRDVDHVTVDADTVSISIGVAAGHGEQVVGRITIREAVSVDARGKSWGTLKIRYR